MFGESGIKLTGGLKELDTALTERFEPQIARSLKITGASGAGNLLVGIRKLLMGIYSLSFFTCVSALYTFGMVMAKYCVLFGLIKTSNKNEQSRRTMYSGLILTVASLLYMGYSARLFFYPSTPSFRLPVALGIASFTFAELTLNIRGVIIARKNHAAPIQAIKVINLCASLICLVLTQAALLALSSTANLEVHAGATGILGVLMGGIAAMMGVVIMFRVQKAYRITSSNGRDES